MKTLLTVDWDFFVPIDPMYDLAHQEAPIFLNLLWQARQGLRNFIKTNGIQEGFWNRLGGIAEGAGPTWVSDSHLFAHSLLSGIDHVILVDAHHDCWNQAKKGQVECSDWLRVWLQGGKRRKATWVSPDWSKDHFSVPKDLCDKLTRVSWGDSWGVKHIDRVHVCRSGCWTPPWLDGEFIKFVQDRGSRVNQMQVGEWDPMRERWSKDEMEASLEQSKVQKSFLILDPKR